MNALAPIKPATFRDRLATLTDHERLLLIDQIADGFTDEGLSDELAEGISNAFDRAEANRTCAFFPFHPSSYATRSDWSEWRSERDGRIAYLFGGA